MKINSIFDFWKKKYTVTLMTNTWRPYRKVYNVSILPREGELINLEGLNVYEEVVNVIHSFYQNGKQHIFVITQKSKLQPEKIFFEKS